MTFSPVSKAAQRILRQHQAICPASMCWLAHLRCRRTMPQHALTALGYGLGRVLTATVAAVIVASPWLWWSMVLQPGGNALVRFALAGDRHTTNRDASLWSLIVDAYSSLTASTWVQQKWLELLRMAGLGPVWNSYGETAQFPADTSIAGQWRVLDFFVLGRTIFFPIVSLVAAGVLAGQNMRSLAVPLSVGIAGVMLTLLVALLSMFVHQLPYGSVLLMALCGVAVLGMLPFVVRWTITGCAVGYAALVWIAPLYQATTSINWQNLPGILLALTLLLCAATSGPRPSRESIVQ